MSARMFQNTLHDEYGDALTLHLVGNVMDAKQWTVSQEFLRCLDPLLAPTLLEQGKIAGVSGEAVPNLAKLLGVDKALDVLRSEIARSRGLLVNKRFDELDRLQQIQKQFRLSATAVSILGVLHLEATSLLFSDILNELGWSTYSQGMPRNIRLLSMMLGIPLPAVLREFAADGLLQRLQLVEMDTLDLPLEISQFLSGFSSEPLDGMFFKAMNGPRRPLSDYGSLEGSLRKTVALLRAARTDGRGAVVVLHGDAGTGKTSAVQTIASEAGFDQAFEIARLSTEKRGEDFRWRAMAAAKQALDPRTSLLVVDEADEIDEDSLRGKGILTELLDSSAHCWIFVGNAKPFSHEALQRRVSFEIEFSKPDKLFRQRLWEGIAREEGLDLGAQKVARISEELGLSPGSIHTVCRDARRLHAQSSSGQALDEVVLETGCMHAKGLGLNFEPKDQPKKPEGLIWREDCLNIRGGLDDPLRKLHAFAKCFGEKDPTLPVRQMCFLASGEPGTGKSAFIRKLAEQAEIPLHAHTAADVLGAYVGETEKGIRRVFHAAREEGALLFLDEVDSLLWSRSRAERSWEVTQVNQLLQEIDHFEGLFAAATNNLDILDPAVLRRFQVKLEFLPLNAEQRIRLWKEQFAGISAESEAPEAELHSLDGLVAGDFRVVWMQAALEDHPCSSANLISRLRAELASRPSRRRPLGFTL